MLVMGVEDGVFGEAGAAAPIEDAPLLLSSNWIRGDSENMRLLLCRLFSRLLLKDDDPFKLDLLDMVLICGMDGIDMGDGK